MAVNRLAFGLTVTPPGFPRPPGIREKREFDLLHREGGKRAGIQQILLKTGKKSGNSKKNLSENTKIQTRRPFLLSLCQRVYQHDLRVRNMLIEDHKIRHSQSLGPFRNERDFGTS